MTPPSALVRWAGRPTLLAIAAMNAITGLAALWVLAPLSFGLDALAYRRGAIALAAGGYDKDFLYTPLAALLATPLTWMPELAAAWLMSLIGIGVLTLGVVAETRGGVPLDRLLVAIAAFGFLPVVNDLVLGQTTLLLAATLWPVVRRADRVPSGIAFGIAVALAPKPALIPVVLWMLVWRRRALAGAIGAGLATALIGLVLLGPDAHLRWLEVLVRAGTLERHGNVSLWVGGVTPLSLALGATVAVVASIAVWRREDAGLAAALAAGLLLAPYTLIYAASILLLAVRPALKFAPVSVRALALVGNPATIAVPTLWLGGALLASGAAIRRRAP